jgi:hypothetical protein
MIVCIGIWIIGRKYVRRKICVTVTVTSKNYESYRTNTRGVWLRRGMKYLKSAVRLKGAGHAYVS